MPPKRNSRSNAQRANRKSKIQKTRTPKSTSGENKEFQAAQKRYDGLIKKKKYSIICRHSPIIPTRIGWSYK
jgi:hypothetical protein